MFAVKRMVSAQPPNLTLTILQHMMARQLKCYRQLCTLAVPYTSHSLSLQWVGMHLILKWHGMSCRNKCHQSLNVW